MDENMVNTNEVVDNEELETILSEDDGISGKDVALVAGGIAVVAAAGYGVFQLGKKGVNKVKQWNADRKMKKAIKKEMEANEDFDAEGEFTEEA